MGRNSSVLTPNDIAQLPGGCAGCLRWERFVDGSGLPAPGRQPAVVDKQRWWTQTQSAGAGGGIVIRVASSGDGASPVVGYATYAVPAPSGATALRVLGLHVDASCRGVGLGRVLVQAVAREALRRPRVRAVEALAGPPTGDRCLVPLGFWLACGFSIAREHPLTPTVRLDARVLAVWRTEVEEAVEQAWERLRGAVRPEPVPRPALSGQPRSSTPLRCR